MAKLNKKSQSSTNMPWDLTFVEFCREAVLCLIELFLWLLAMGAAPCHPDLRTAPFR